MVRQAAPRGLGKHCHCCRQKRPTSQLIPCGASQGEGGAKHGPWCHRCILTKLHKNATYIEAAAVAAKQGTWKCPRCDDVCPCNKCDQRRSKESKHRKPRPVSSSGDRDPSVQDPTDTADNTSFNPDQGTGEDEPATLPTQPYYGFEESDSYSSPENSPAQTPTPRLGVGYMEYKLQDTDVEEKHDDWEEEELQQGGSNFGDSADAAGDQILPVHTETITEPDACGGASTLKSCSYKDAHPSWVEEEQSARTVEAPKIIAMAKRRATGRTAETVTSSLLEPRKSLGRLLIQKIINAVVEEEDVDIEGVPQQGETRAGRPNSVKPASILTNRGSKETEGPPCKGSTEQGAAVLQVSPPPPRSSRNASKGDKGECSGQLLCGPQTPSTPDTVKGGLGSPRRSGTLAQAGARVPFRKRLTRKGVPSRGDAGVDIKAADYSSGTSAEANNDIKDSALMASSPKKAGELPHPCSPDVSFESLERARLQDEEEGVVNSSITVDRKTNMGSSTCPSSSDVGLLLERMGSSYFSPGRTVIDMEPQMPPSPSGNPSLKGDNEALVLEHPPRRKPRSKRFGSHVTPSRPPKVFKPAFSDDISYEAPSPTHTSESSDSEGCSRPTSVSTRYTGMVNRAPPAQPPESPKDAWIPPVSPYGLIQEKLYEDPWKLLVACMLLNKTSGQQMYRVIWDFFRLIPTAQSAIEAKTEDIGVAIHSLGLYNKRAAMIQRFSREFLYSDWVDVSELHGIGKYAADAHAIFCEGRWRDVEPDDHMLQKYWEWLHDTDGQGQGFLRV